MLTAPRIEPPFGAHVAFELVALALGWKTLGGDLCAFSELGDMRFQVRSPLSPTYERAQ
jgi:hypothetical protein